MTGMFWCSHYKPKHNAAKSLDEEEDGDGFAIAGSNDTTQIFFNGEKIFPCWSQLHDYSANRSPISSITLTEKMEKFESR